MNEKKDIKVGTAVVFGTSLVVLVAVAMIAIVVLSQPLVVAGKNGSGAIAAQGQKAQIFAEPRSGADGQLDKEGATIAAVGKDSGAGEEGVGDAGESDASDEGSGDAAASGDESGWGGNSAAHGQKSNKEWVPPRDIWVESGYWETQTIEHPAVYAEQGVYGARCNDCGFVTSDPSVLRSHQDGSGHGRYSTGVLIGTEPYVLIEAWTEEKKVWKDTSHWEQQPGYWK